MKLNPQQLPAHLATGLVPFYVLSGDEPLLVDEALEAVRDAAAEAGYHHRESYLVERGFDWQALAGGLQNFSLFATRRVVELRLPTGKPGDAGAKFIANLVDKPVPDTVMVFIMPALDSRALRSRWAKSLDQAGVWLTVRAPDHAALPGWIANRTAKAGLQLDQEALDFLAARVEGNLMAAKHEIDKLVLLARSGPVTVETVRQSVGDEARFDVFRLTDAALAGDRSRAARILLNLEREGVAPQLVLWALSREIGVLIEIVCGIAGGRSVGKAMAAAGVWRSRQSVLGKAAKSHTTGSAAALIARAAATDRIVQGARRGNAWNALMELTLALAGAGQLAAETGTG